jgi:hypothetical protein
VWPPASIPDFRPDKLSGWRLGLPGPHLVAGFADTRTSLAVAERVAGEPPGAPAEPAHSRLLVLLSPPSFASRFWPETLRVEADRYQGIEEPLREYAGDGWELYGPPLPTVTVSLQRKRN